MGGANNATETLPNILPELFQKSLSRMSSVASAAASVSDSDLATNSGTTDSMLLYEHLYDTMMSIGKGVSGFVKLARRRADNKEVVVKFLLKAKLSSDAFVCDQNGRKLPQEAELLMRLSHPNITKVEAVFENNEFFQLVMPKHGSGMNLFEFIDRRPQLDEALVAYMFSQLVDAVAYLHDQNIVHRDIKDENIVLDDRFNIKMIDFGAAKPMVEGELFSTFSGTIEYCSPEILLGERYRGTEADVFSTGVTLYTLLFGESPFFDLEETLAGELQPPWTASSEVMDLLRRMLYTNPLMRATIFDAKSHVWTNQKVDISQYRFDTILPNNGEN